MGGLGGPGFGAVNPLLRDDTCMEMYVVLQDSPEEITFGPTHQTVDVSRKCCRQRPLRFVGRKVDDDGCIVADGGGQVQDREIAGVSGNVCHIEEIVTKECLGLVS